MDIIEKIRVLGAGAKYDNCGCSVPKTKQDDRFKDALQHAIYETSSEGGMKTKLFKTLMSNSCSFDWKYCLNSTRCQKKSNNTSFEPKELAETFNYLYKNKYVEGLFLSSGISSDPDRMAEKMIEAVSMIRVKYHFRGYVHMKILPGSSYETVKRSAEISTRLSINIEAPNKERINELSSTKEFKSDILRRQAWIKKQKVPAGQTTQVIVGAGEETDLEIIKMVDWEYREMDLKRFYYNSFSPVKGTPMENKEAVESLREFRLYNVDFLFRKYGYRLKEVEGIMDDGMLPREDPKILIARQSFEGHVDVNDLGYRELLRIPGIGPTSANRIVSKTRTGQKIKTKKDLKACGVVLKRALPFVEVGGERQKLINNF
ncbi:MAG: radical SAM protein [Nanoarchaeota archaeon]|nr:radical SAM protein [Nanoarchaeota archaeon]